MYIVKLTSLLLTAAGLVSCGGNNTQSSKEILEGKWTGVLTFIESIPNTCSAQGAISESHTVSVNDRTITLEGSSGLRHDGMLIAENEFDATFLQVGAQAEFGQTISYRNVVNGRAEVTVTTTERSFERSCTRKWSGTMVR